MKNVFLLYISCPESKDKNWSNPVTGSMLLDGSDKREKGKRSGAFWVKCSIQLSYSICRVEMSGHSKWLISSVVFLRGKGLI